MDVFQERVNMIVASVSTVLAFFLGEFWWMFLAFLVLNIADYSTGWYKSRYTKTESSSRGAHGIAKKVGYWVIIGIAFFISITFLEIGEVIGVELGFMPLVGYFVLITYIVNELRSIIENLVVCGVDIPEFLIKGLEISEKLIKDKANSNTGGGKNG